MKKITDDMDSLTGSSVVSEMSENFDSDFGKANKDIDEDDDEYSTICTKDIESEGRSIAHLTWPLTNLFLRIFF